ncbi:L-galactose dehydrogenase [Micractinium conductrix]|uniref:L-galactose dehydrogenase n=1 Tax=Micractinium conductrix TaxID=554055 RepID=A0A2P6VD23_9CHLO|nr:L-galactose dehydrogenase [Micractinium conductrix]|eukprot:PSC71979.1 L-galactose dehydrogenase [Micractinium conductrix]
MFPWERRQLQGGDLRWWEKLYWGVFVVGIALILFNRIEWEKEPDPKVEERKVALETARQETARMVLAGKSILVPWGTDDPFADMSPQEIEEFCSQCEVSRSVAQPPCSTTAMAAAAAPKLPRRRLGDTGLEVSVLGFGASPLGGVFHDIDEGEGVAAVKEAFDLGINLFDTSPFYGATKSEAVLGRGLAQLPRDQIVVATKVGRSGPTDFDFSAARITASVHESLARLGLEYVDLIQCHDIEFTHLDQIVNETLPALAELKKQGLVRHVGITGLPLKIFRCVLDRVPPGLVDTALSYCHYSLNDTSLEGLLPYLQGKGLGVINASPLSMGLLTHQGPPEWHPAPEPLQRAAAEAAQAAAAHGADLPKLALMEAVKNTAIASTLVGICTRQQVRDNVSAVLQGLGLEASPLAEAEAAALADVKRILEPVQGMTWSSGLPENN